MKFTSWLGVKVAWFAVVLTGCATEVGQGGGHEPEIATQTEPDGRRRGADACSDASDAGAESDAGR
jgi:hypothetical protein